jgi:pilus assembly protein Flp/PilA
MMTRFLRDETGTTALEYAVIGALISVAIMLAIVPIGEALSDIFGQAKAGIAPAGGG